MANSPYIVTRPVPRDPADEFTRDGLFSTDKRVNGLNIDTGRISGCHVVEVSDDGDQLDDALRAAGADLLGAQYGYARQGFVRAALCPVGHGAGRERWR